jgi:hypothetical protein
MGRDLVIAVAEQADDRSRDSRRDGVLTEQVRKVGRHHRTRLGLTTHRLSRRSLRDLLNQRGTNLILLA